jgi:hypothetical protein
MNKKSFKKLKNFFNQKIRRRIYLVFLFILSILLSLLFFLIILKPVINFYFLGNYQIEEFEDSFVYKRHLKFNNFYPEYFSPFFDSFYNLSDVKSYSNLYYDVTFSAFMSQPEYEFKRVDIEDYNIDTEINNQRNGDYNKVCIENDCLERKGKKLYINQNNIYLPSFKGSLEFVSIDRLENEFYVSFVILEDDVYKVRFYIYDNYFTEVLKEINIESEEPGVVGIGGVKDDFLIFYGSPIGPLYRVVNGEIYDSTSILSRRMTSSYFKPEIERVINSSGRADFYVYSNDSNKKILLKLWDNNGDSNNLSGVIDLYNLLKIESTVLDVENVSREDSFNNIFLKLNDNNNYLFTDKGFDNNLKGEIISEQIPDNNTIFDFKIKEIEKINLNIDSESLSLNDNKGFSLQVKEIFDANEEVKYFSNTNIRDDLDSDVWEEIDLSEPLKSFSGNKIEGFRLRLIFPKFDDNYSSPFLNSWSVNYYYYK